MAGIKHRGECFSDLDAIRIWMERIEQVVAGVLQDGRG
jgi:hypothetical protein